MASPTRKLFSVFDYTITISRKHRYLVVGSPEFGFYVASTCLGQDQVSPTAIGESVIRVFEHINARLHELALSGEPRPKPIRKKRLAQVLSEEDIPS